MSARTAMAVSVVLCLALTGCGREGGGSGGGSGAQSLAEFMGWDNEDWDSAENQARWQEEERQREEQIAACMAKEGWQYTPVDHSQYQHTPTDDIPWDDPEAFREKYGYGITTMDEVWEQEPDTEFHDPNQEYVESLSEADQQAYWEALHGVWDESMMTEDPETGEMWGGDSIGGCYNEIWQEQQGDTQDLWEELNPKFEELWERVQSDPRLVQATEKWAACMQEAGYTFARLDEPHEHIAERSNALWENQQDPFEGMSEDEINEFWENLTPERERELFGPDPVLKAEIAAEELALAAVDGECQEKHVGDLQEKIHTELEAQFIAENRELLEKIRDAEGTG